MKKKLEKFVALEIIKEWQEAAEQILKNAKPRNIEIGFSNLGAIAITGVRRCGKTSLALLKAKEISISNYLYINFEDPRFIEYNDFSVFDILIEVFVEYKQTAPKVIIFDELQNISGWERWVRKFVDTKKIKIIITGSSARMLSSELATAVAGRVLEYRIWPLSFQEFLNFKNYSKDQELLALFSEYIDFGGFPEIIFTPQLQMKKRILQQYFSDILFKDVMSRKGIRDKRTLERIIYHYLTNISCHHSYSALKKAYQLGGETPNNYTQFLEDAFLIFEVERFHKNLKVQSRDTKKIYTIDTGLRNFNSKSLTGDAGKLVENVIFLHLQRLEFKVFYFKENLETDFVLVDRNKTIAAIQVTDSNLEEEKLYQREVYGLLECLKTTGLKEGTLLTKSRHEVKRIEDKVIKMLPIHDWLSKKIEVINTP